MSGGFLDDDADDSSDDVVDVDGEIVQETGDKVVPSSSSTNMGLVKPVTKDLAEVSEAYQMFEQVKDDLLDKSSDIETAGGKPFITKSGWRKIATAFGVTTEIVREKKTVENGVVSWKVVAEAKAPNGQGTSGVGMCASNESNFTERLHDNKSDKPSTDLDGDVAWIEGCWRRVKPPVELKEHDIYATAATRAKNRAISDLVGGGEVSADELSADDFMS